MFGQIIVLIIATGFLTVGVILWRRANHLLTAGKRASAVVFENVFEYNRNGGVYYPVVRFQNERQEWVAVQLKIGRRPPIPEGTKLEILYDPENSGEAEINSGFYLEVLPRIMVVAGLFGMVFAILEALGITSYLTK